jgi:hypothetical protein
MCTESSYPTEALDQDSELEPCTVKVVSTVLRGAGDHKEPRLPGEVMEREYQ